MGVGRRTIHWQGSESCRLLPSSALFLGPAFHSLQGLHKEGVKANPDQAQTQSLYGTKEAVGQREPGAISEVFVGGAVASQRNRKYGKLEEWAGHCKRKEELSPARVRVTDLSAKASWRSRVKAMCYA